MTSYCYNASDNKLPRVLLVGDSICKGYESLVRDELAGSAYVSFYATSKCVTDPTYLKALAFVIEEYDYKVVHFNNGLHSLSADRKAWEAGLGAAVNLIQERAKGTKLIWASSTPLKDPALTGKATELNGIAERIMKANHVPIDDLYALMNPLDRGTFWVDTYHYTPEARKMQAKQVADLIREALGAKKAGAQEARAALSAAASETGPNGKISTLTESSGVPENAGFEEKGAWSLFPAAPAKGSWELSAENPHSGATAARIVVASPGLQFFQHKLALEAGASYTLKYWARSEPSSSVNVFMRTRKPPYVFPVRSTGNLSDHWKECSAVVTLPADFSAENYTLFFEFPSEGTYWIDDVSFTKK
ncbi:MAG: SGNH/GDSL hydrolase family protein [Chthoniobacteraceae bacterium]